MLLRLILVFTLLTASTQVLADAVDINLSNDVAQFQYLAPMGQVGQGKSEFHMGFLYNDSNNILGDMGLLVKNNAGNADILSGGIGGKVVVARITSNNAAALALGGKLRYAPFADKRWGIIGQVYFAPDIVTFGDADRYIQTGVGIEYEIMPQAAAYVGYRNIKVGMKATLAPDARLDEGAHIGVRIAF
ncbi:MAG: YfaZ family outer membrane protein [Gallionellaceae bacterium]|nr:YfaZ family outer membrane protein [Gallionellaceae bacterium]